MDWLKKNYERAILAVAILALIGSSVFIVMGSMDFPTTFATRNSSKRPDNTIKPLPIEVLQTAAQAVDKAKIWTSHDGSLFISRPYVLLNNELIDPLAAGKDLHAPITNAWLIKYDLPYWEGDIKDQDPDGDRFSNLEEFVNNTDPLDAKSVPPYWTKLRLAKFISKPFRLKFTGTPDEGQTFTINAIDGKSRTQFLQLGQMIEGTPYKLLSYKPNKINSFYGTAKAYEQQYLVSKGVTDKAELERRSNEAGRTMLIKVLQQFTGIKIDHYAEVNLISFYLLSKAVGGVPVCLVKATKDRQSGADFPAGHFEVEGSSALSFVRQRHGLPGGDLDRIKRQQMFLASAANKILSVGTLTSRLTRGRDALHMLLGEQA